MRIVKGFITILLGFLLLGLIWGFFVDPQWEVTVRQEIPAEKTIVFPYLNTLENWPNWTVWNTTNYPDMKMTYEGATSGVGAIQHWNDGGTQGILKITDSITDTFLKYQLNMGNNSIVMHGEFSLVSRGDKTIVTWIVQGNAGSNPIARLMMFAYKPMIEKDLIGSLENLAILAANGS